jgi:hypothetical protein
VKIWNGSETVTPTTSAEIALANSIAFLIACSESLEPSVGTKIRLNMRSSFTESDLIASLQQLLLISLFLCAAAEFDLGHISRCRSYTARRQRARTGVESFARIRFQNVDGQPSRCQRRLYISPPANREHYLRTLAPTLASRRDF